MTDKTIIYFKGHCDYGISARKFHDPRISRYNWGRGSTAAHLGASHRVEEIGATASSIWDHLVHIYPGGLAHKNDWATMTSFCYGFSTGGTQEAQNIAQANANGRT